MSVVASHKKAPSAKQLVAQAHAEARWFVLRTRSRQEKCLAGVLASYPGVHVFLPMISRTRFYGHRKRVTEVPLFSGYLFAHGPVEAEYLALDSGRAVDRLRVLDQARFDHEIAQIRIALQAGQVFLDHDFLQTGRRVRVARGPLVGIEGVVESRPRPTRLVLQIQALGQATSLEIDADLLESAE